MIPAFFGAQHASVLGANEDNVKEETVVRRILFSEREYFYQNLATVL